MQRIGAAPLALALPACTAADANLSIWTILILAALPIGMPLYYLARGKIEDWLSLAEWSVRWSERGWAASFRRENAAASDCWDRANRCAASIPQLVRGRLLARARRLAGAALLCLVLGGCDTTPRGRAREEGTAAALGADICRITCHPYAWSIRLETYVSREHGCSCSGPGATDGGQSTAPRERPVPAIAMGGGR